MSLFHPVNLVCPNCGAAITMRAVGSVNADRRPDYRDDILEDRFQDVTCEACGTSSRLQPQFNYLDAGRGQWIAAFPAHRVQDHRELIAEISELFEESYGAGAPEAAQAVGEGLDVRLTFGWPAVREKLYLREHGLDDEIIEMMKLHMLRKLPSAPIQAGVELRCVGVTDDLLVFAWIETASEKGIETIQAPREIYDTIAANVEGWQQVRNTLQDSAFVDMQKLYMGVDA